MIEPIDLGIPGLTNIKRIGAGGNAIVYRARQRDLDRDVVVKVLLNVDAETTRRRFDRERRAMGRLSQSAGIAPLYGSGFTPTGQPYLLMPFYEPGSLQDRLEHDGALPATEVQRIGVIVCKAIQTAHENGVLHRDLKPANILMSRSGQPDVADFGIAHLVDDAMATTQALTMTPLYTAPEIFDGLESGAASDVYSIGATLYALLNGYPAHSDPQGTTPVLSLMRRINEDPLPQLPPEAPPELVDVVAKAMSKDPRDRYPNAGDMAAALARASMEPPRQRKIPSRSIVFAAIAVLLAAAGGVLAATVLINNQEPAEQIAGDPDGEPSATETPAAAPTVTATPVAEVAPSLNIAAARATAQKGLVRVEAFSCTGVQLASGVLLGDGLAVTTDKVLDSPWYVDVTIGGQVRHGGVLNTNSRPGLAFVNFDNESEFEILPRDEVVDGEQVAIVGIDALPAVATVAEVDGAWKATLLDERAGNAIEPADIVVSDSGGLVGIAVVDSGEITIIPPSEISAGPETQTDYDCTAPLQARDFGPTDAESAQSPAIRELLTMQQLSNAYAQEQWPLVRQLEPDKADMTDAQFIVGWRPLRQGYVFPVERTVLPAGIVEWRIGLIGHETWNGNDLTTLFCLTWTVDPGSGAITQTNEDSVAVFGSLPTAPQRPGFSNPGDLRTLIDSNCPL